MVKYSLLSFLWLAGVNADENRIIGGDNVVSGMYPWFARSVKFDKRREGCGASLISAEYILTAGTCTMVVSLLLVCNLYCTSSV